MKKFIIRSVRRQPPNNYFCAIHGFTPFYATREKARQFNSKEEAHEYAFRELFDNAIAFCIEEI
jgi:hypothetical protein